MFSDRSYSTTKKQSLQSLHSPDKIEEVCKIIQSEMTNEDTISNQNRK